MRFSSYLLAALTLTACASPPPPPPKPVEESVASDKLTQGPDGTHYEGGDARTCENPVRIEGAGTAAQGVKAQHFWIEHHFPRARKLARDSLRCNDIPIERVNIMAESGEQIELFFDITQYMNK